MARVKLRAFVLFGICLNAFGREILNYTEGSVTRREEGRPGKSVTGEWTWVDDDGTKRKIWYIADTKGFRAFGDLVPQMWYDKAEEDMPQIGSSVVPTLRRDTIVDSSDPEEGREISGRKTKKTSSQILREKLLDDGNSISRSDARSDYEEISDSRMLTDDDDRTLAKNKQASRGSSRKSGFESTKEKFIESKNVNEIAETDRSVDVTGRMSSSSVAGIKQGILTRSDTSSGIDGTGEMLSSSDATSRMLSSAMKAPDTTNILPGTSFVLLSKRVPTFSSVATPGGAGQIKPVPVSNGSPQAVVTGILTAPRARTVLYNNKKAKAFPASVDSQRRTPKPSKVEGMINLENFLRPARVPGSGHLPRTPSTMDMDYDYYYYDDYYYDDTDSNSTVTTVANNNLQHSTSTAAPQTSTVNSKRTTVTPKSSTVNLRRAFGFGKTSRQTRSEESGESLEDDTSRERK